MTVTNLNQCLYMKDGTVPEHELEIYRKEWPKGIKTRLYTYNEYNGIPKKETSTYRIPIINKKDFLRLAELGLYTIFEESFSYHHEDDWAELVKIRLEADRVAAFADMGISVGRYVITKSRLEKESPNEEWNALADILTAWIDELYKRLCDVSYKHSALRRFVDEPQGKIYAKGFD